MIKQSSLKSHIIWLAITGIFCFSCLIVSALTPKLGFEIGVRDSGRKNDIVVKRIQNDETQVQIGDIIETVNGRPIHTKAELYHELLTSHQQAELTIRRTGSRFQRPIDASELAHGAIPAGLKPSDKPVLIEDEDGYTPLEGVDFETLKTMLEDRDEAVSVVFKRQEEIVSTTISLYPAPNRTFGASLCILLIALMGVVAARNHKGFRKGHAARANMTLGLAAIGVTTLGLWNIIVSIPILFTLGIIGLTLFKVVDLDYHLVHFATGRKKELWTRIILFVGPIATLIVPVWLSLSEMPVLWHGIIDDDTELKLAESVLMPMIWVVIYTIVDGGILIARRHKNPHAPLQAYEIGVGISCFLAIFVFALVRSDIMWAQWFLMAMILTQGICNVIPALNAEQTYGNRKLDDPIFSLVPVRVALDRALETLGDAWLIQVVIDRPTPKHIVSMVRSDEDDALNGLALNVLSDNWRDFFEVFRLEGTPITGESQNRDERNPAHGIAERMGIVIALPIADNVAGTLTSLTLIVSASHQNHIQDAANFSTTPAQRAKLTEIIEDLTNAAPALVYQSAEISLDFVGDDLNEIAIQNATSSISKNLRNPTTPLDARELPHGLLDEDLDEEDEAANEIDVKDIAPETPSQAPKEFDTSVYAEEVFFLRSQVQALYSQQMRAYALDEIELTAAQKATLEEIDASDPPILFIGEPGTGKRLMAHAAHKARSEGAFLTIDAAEVPESIFMLDVLGDGDNPSLIQAAAGGSLLIQNIDRISSDILDDILKTIQALPAKESVALYMTITTTPIEFSVSQYRSEPLKLPDWLKKLAIQTDAEIIAIDPLRDQPDIEVVADFFRQKQAIRANVQVDSFTPEAILALKSYAWPGNFAEIKSVIDRAVMQCESSQITVKDLGRDFITLADASTKDIALSNTDLFREQVQVMSMINESQQEQIQKLNERIEQLEKLLNEQTNGNESQNDLLEGSFADIEKRLLDKILNKYHRDPDKAADALALNRARFFNKLSKYQLI